MSCPAVIKVVTPGPPGPPGPIGPAGIGSAWQQGAGVPSSGTGANGDFYLNINNGDIYGPKAAGSWGSVIFNIAEGQAGPAGPAGPQGPAGAAGVNGRTVLNGSGAPSSGTGANGDFYIDITGWVIYGPKAGGSWPGGASLIGPTGSVGPIGPQGPKGDPGNPAPGTDLSYNPSTRLLSSSTGQDVTLPLAGTDAGLLGGVSFTGPSGWAASGSVSSGTITLSLSLPAGSSLVASGDRTAWDTAYAERLRWDGGSTGLNASTARTSLGLGTAATTDASAYATAAQGAKADTAVQPAGLSTALSSKADLVNGTVPAAQLPGFVDDVLEFANVAAFPATGEAGKLYISLATNRQYRWSGSTYVEINPSPGSTDAVPEGSVNLYFTAGRAAAAAPVQSVAGRTGNVTLSVGDVSGAVGTNDARLTDSREWSAATIDQAEAEAGIGTTRRAFTALRVRQAIAAWWSTITTISLPAGSAPSTPATGFALFANASNALSWIGANGFTRTFDGTTNTANRTYTLPNASGTVALTSDIPGVATTSAAGLMPATIFAAITYAADVELDMAALDGQVRTISLTGNLSLTSINRAAGRSVSLRIIADGTQRTLIFPAGWVFVGPKPANIAASKTGVLSLTFFGTASTDAIAAWGVQG